jgi:hypothetical protein
MPALDQVAHQQVPGAQVEDVVLQAGTISTGSCLEVWARARPSPDEAYS